MRLLISTYCFVFINLGFVYSFKLSAPCKPRQIHLSLGDQISERYTSITVSFTLSELCKPDKVHVRVYFSEESRFEHDCKWADATQDSIHQYNHTSTVSGDFYSSPWIYHINLQGLKGNTEYFYKIVVHDVNTAYQERRLRGSHEQRNPFLLGASPTLDFVTAPTKISAGTNNIQTHIAFLGDLGQTENSTRTMRNLLKYRDQDVAPISLGLCVGDMSYADSNQTLWDTWFDLMEPLLSRLPLLVAAGNHEIECDRQSHLPFLAYENRFRMPNRIANATILPVDEAYFHTEYGCSTPSIFSGTFDFGNAYYSFKYGLAYLIVLSSYSDTMVGSVQYQWLEQELARIDRTETPWLIIAMHTQFYTTFKGHNNETQTVIMKDSMEALFAQYRVNLVFSGHDHAYMRSKSVFHGILDESLINPVYIIVGEGGNKEGHVKEYLNQKPEIWVASRDKTVYGFGKLLIVNNTHAHWKWIMDDEDSVVGSFIDETWMYNSFYL